MRLEFLAEKYVNEFLLYCEKYGKEHDTSYLGSIDMNDQDFTDTNKNPTVIMLDEKDNIVGVISVMLYLDFSSDTKKHRIRIFHSTIRTYEAYKLLLDKLLELHIPSEQLFIFIPKKDVTLHMPKILKDLGFDTERISYVLKRYGKTYEEPQFEEGFSIREVNTKTELDAYADIRNECFKNLSGTRIKTGKDFEELVNSPLFISGSMMFLNYNEQIIGFLSVAHDEDDEEDEAGIIGIGLKESYRGKGIGRQLLRHGIKFLIDRGYKQLWLSVHGENESAVHVYKKEGFNVDEEVVCYNKLIK